MKIILKPVNIFAEPPINVQLLAQDPNGTLHLTRWRPAYNIFDCMGKHDSLEGWYYTEIDIKKEEL